MPLKITKIRGKNAHRAPSINFGAFARSSGDSLNPPSSARENRPDPKSYVTEPFRRVPIRHLRGPSKCVRWPCEQEWNQAGPRQRTKKSISLATIDPNPLGWHTPALLCTRWTTPSTEFREQGERAPMQKVRYVSQAAQARGCSCQAFDKSTPDRAGYGNHDDRSTYRTTCDLNSEVAMVDCRQAFQPHLPAIQQAFRRPIFRGDSLF